MKNILLLFLLFIPLLAITQFHDPEFIATAFGNVSQFAHGDVDNDGKLDLIFISKNSYQIGWSKNIDNNGTWGTAHMIESDYESPVAIKAGDMNGDDLIDIVILFNQQVSGNFDNLLVWFENLGEGNFSLGHEIGGGNNPVSTSENGTLDIADIDNDGDLDIAAGYKIANEVILFKNNGLGYFGNKIELATGFNNPLDLKFVHLNSDEFIDIVVQSDGDFVSFFENFNGITFAAPTIIASPSTKMSHIDVGDIDGDGDADIIANSQLFDHIIFFENLNNDGIFGTAIPLVENLNIVGDIVATDIDNDDDIDILFITQDEGLFWSENIPGSTSFQEPVLVATYSDFYTDTDITPFDYDQDGDLDLFIAEGKTYFIERTSNLTFGEVQFFPVSLNQMSGVEFTDVDNDGMHDIVAYDNGNLYVQMYNSEFDLFERPISFDQVFDLRKIDFTDINGDGFEDVVAVVGMSQGFDQFRWYLNDGQGFFSSEGQVEVGSYISDVVKKDLDNDGLDDFVVVSNEEIFWIRNIAGTSGFSEPISVTPYDSYEITLEVMDVNADGFKDIIYTLDETNDFCYWVKNEAGVFSNPEVLLTDFSSDPKEIIALDIDNNGIEELIVTISSGYQYYKSNEDNIYELFQTLSITDVNVFEKLVDLDCDGYGDLLYQRSNQELEWARYDSITGHFDESKKLNFDIGNLDLLKIVDIDSDGDMDIVYGNYGKLYYAKSILRNPLLLTSAFFDVNQNQIFDTDESILDGVEFLLSPTSLYTLNNESGQVKYFVENGDYELSILPFQNWELISNPSFFDIQIDTASGIFIHNFAMIPTSTFTDLQLDLTSAPTRCSFEVPFWLNVDNKGTTLNEGLLELKVIQHADFVLAEPAPDSIDLNSYYWKIDSLWPTYNEQFNLTFTIADASNIGQFVEMEVYFLEQQNLNAYDTLSSFVFASEVNCAYDPNDKSVNPPGVQEEHYTLFGEELEYTIRFQNTGTDTAFNISVWDILDVDLDWNSFRVISHSHDMETSLDLETGEVRFLFSNILLPDSIVNETLSHGFIKYKITPNSGLDENTEVTNHADIYFDFNDPIRTNTTLNTFVSVIPSETSIDEVMQFTFGVKPNPFQNYFNIQFKSPTDPKEVSIKMYDLLGQEINVHIEPGLNSLNVQPENISSGTYLCSLYYKGVPYNFTIIKIQ